MPVRIPVTIAGLIAALILITKLVWGHAETTFVPRKEFDGEMKTLSAATNRLEAAVSSVEKNADEQKRTNKEINDVLSDVKVQLGRIDERDRYNRMGR